MLSDTKLRTLKPRDKAYRVTDERGLYVQVSVTGTKLWRFKYKFDGKEKLLALGQYPDVPLTEARRRRDEARQQVARGIDPSGLRRAEKSARGDTFGALFDEWQEERKATCAAITISKDESRANNHILPYLKDVPVAQVTKDRVKDIITRTAALGRQDAAHRILNLISQVMRYAVLHDRAPVDPTAPIREGRVLKPVRSKHYAALLDRASLGNYIKVAHGYSFSPIVRAALLLQALLFVRPGELRKLEWSNVDFEAGLLRIVPENLKLSTEEKQNPANRHLVPLSRQAVKILKELHKLTGESRYVFLSPRFIGRSPDTHRPISDNTVNVALRTLGYAPGTLTGHGFRATARTLIAEELSRHLRFQNVYISEVIELQLAHTVKDPNGTAYNRTQFLNERHKLMQVWADWLWEIGGIA